MEMIIKALIFGAILLSARVAVAPLKTPVPEYIFVGGNEIYDDNHDLLAGPSLCVVNCEDQWLK